MPLSTVELANAREFVKKILDELKLEDYLFDVEPVENNLVVKVECAADGGWQSLDIQVAQDLLLRGVDNYGAHQQILDNWRNVLSACLSETKKNV